MKIDREKATKLWENGLLDSQIAKELGCSDMGIAHWRQRNGMASNHGIFNWDPFEYRDTDNRDYSKGVRV